MGAAAGVTLGLAPAGATTIGSGATDAAGNYIGTETLDQLNPDGSQRVFLIGDDFDAGRNDRAGLFYAGPAILDEQNNGIFSPAAANDTAFIARNRGQTNGIFVRQTNSVFRDNAGALLGFEDVTNNEGVSTEVAFKSNGTTRLDQGTVVNPPRLSDVVILQANADNPNSPSVIDQETGSFSLGFSGNEDGNDSVLFYSDLELSVFDQSSGRTETVWSNDGTLFFDFVGLLGASQTDILLTLPSIVLFEDASGNRYDFTGNEFLIFTYTVTESGGGGDTWGLVSEYDCNAGVNGVQSGCTTNFTGTPVPLPASGWLLLAGLGVAATIARRRGAAA